MDIIHIIGAMEEELAGLRATQDEKSLRNGFVIRSSGVGKVNAAIAVACAKERGAFGIISVGTAGALDPTLNIGDVVIVTRAMQHDVDASAVGFPRGTIPFEEEHEWHANPFLVRTAERAARELGFPMTIGGICSGERFVADETEKAWLREHFASACIDMETGAIAHACAKLGIPWVGVRIISDRANGDAATDFPAALAIASDRIARIVPKVIALLPEARGRERVERSRAICPSDRSAP